LEASYCKPATRITSLAWLTSANVFDSTRRSRGRRIAWIAAVPSRVDFHRGKPI
jgi:hypothetical protein